MDLQFNDANVHFERGIFDSFFQYTTWLGWYFLHRLHSATSDIFFSKSQKFLVFLFFHLKCNIFI